VSTGKVSQPVWNNFIH